MDQFLFLGIRGRWAASAPSEAHLLTCLWCYRVYRRGLEADGWQVRRTFTSRRGYPQECCGSMAALLIQVGQIISGQIRECLLDLCHECGHVELIASRCGEIQAG